MQDTMGIIVTGGVNYRLNELTTTRAVAALPIGCRYRLIDFVLSSMVNSGIYNVGVATEYNYSSLMDHLGSGKEWDLSRRIYGLFMLPPNMTRESVQTIKGEMDVLHGALSFLRGSKQTYVLLTGGNMICNMVYDDLLDYHKKSGADITMMYNDLPDDEIDELRNVTILEIDQDNRVTALEDAPRFHKTNHVSTSMMIMERALLIELIEEAFAQGAHQLITEVLIPHINAMDIRAFKYDGYIGRVNSVKSYYQNNMNLLSREVRDTLFFGENPIYTKIKDQVYTQYKEGAKVTDSLVADGCIIEGTVENSILFRGVQVKKGAVIKNSIVMQGTLVGENAQLEQAILDKNCTVGKEKKLIGSETYPIIAVKGAII